MKKLFTYGIAFLAAASVSAQTKITYSNNGLNIGDVRPMKQIEHMDQGKGGANQYWDFSSAKESNSMIISQNANVGTQIGNLDLTSRNTLLACDEGGEKTTYFEITNSEKKYWGLSNGAVNISFNQPIVDMKFPMAYQDVISGTMDGTYSDAINSYPITGSYKTSADAWGTLVLPDGNVYKNVLRVKVEKNYEQAAGSLNYNISTVRYQYFAEGQRYPVLIVMENDVKFDCNCTCGNYTTSSAYYLPVSKIDNFRNEIVINDIADVENEVRVNVYPNPVKDNLNASVEVSTNTEADVELVDASGRMVADYGKYNLVSGKNNLNFEVSNIVAGHYFLRVKVDGINYAKGVIKK